MNITVCLTEDHYTLGGKRAKNLLHWNTEAVLVRSQTGKGNGCDMLQDPQGNLYYKHISTKEGTFRWRCRFFKPVPKGTNCKAKAVTEGSILKSTSRTHNHSIDQVHLAHQQV